jgi:hypothetical protein
MLLASIVLSGGTIALNVSSQGCASSARLHIMLEETVLLG